MGIKMEQFGKDHWSTFAYCETLAVDRKGVVDQIRMRLNGDDYPTRLKGFFVEGGKKDESKVVYGHNDYDCIDDLEEAGLIQNIGTGTNPIVRLTDLGRKIAAQLREFKAQGGSFAYFTPVT